VETEPNEKPKSVLLTLGPNMAEVASAMARQEGVSLTRFSERIVLDEVRRRIKDGYVETFTKNFQRSAQAVLEQAVP
jgi:hypothetical protein